ncbi:MAG: BMP family ABC transporter substrate-binding protein [Lachnospiraceae bacterium]|nr:BMP family ABC transporter substrate-binding protein [Lachnospiraceae bacterium]
MKKRILALLLSCAMVVGLAACGGGSSDNGGGAADNGSAPAPAAEDAESAGEAGSTDLADLTVGAIYINGKNDTAGYTYQHSNGIITAMRNLGMDVDSQLYVVDYVEEDYDAVCQAIDTLVGEGCDIIFGISFGYLDAFNDKAAEYPDVIFSHGTGYLCNDTNFNNYFGRAYQARYLAGIVAGLKSLEEGNNNIGYVAAFGTEYAETASGINGFAMGVRAVNPDATIYVKELGAWGDEPNEYAFAEELINSYNCCVISQHCDSAQAMIAAADAGVYGCGYNSDMTEDAPTAVLTSAVWHWDVYYQTAIEAAAACGGDASQFVTQMGGPAYYAGLAEGFVGYAPLNEAIAPANAQAYLDAVSDLIISGEWDVFSGTALSFEEAEDGTVTVVQTPADLVDNEGNVIVEAGGPSVEDSVITGTMDWFVEGVQDVAG